MKTTITVGFMVAMLSIRADAEPLTLDDPTPTSRDHFGRAVEVHGNLILVGDQDDNTFGQDVGQVRLFDKMTGELLRTFDDPTVTLGDEFGRSMALEGNKVVVGAYRDSTLGFEIGQAHLFSIAPGDYDDDFDVDGNDFLVWQRSKSPNPLSSIDLADWELNFGETLSSAVAAGVSTPERSTLLLVSLAGLLFGSRRRRV